MILQICCAAGATVSVDAANDLALLKADGRFAPLPIAASRTVNLGGTVVTIGFPNISMQGFAPKVLAHGHHGGNRHWEVELRPGDDPRYFQISVVFADGHHAAGQGWSSSFSLLVRRGTR